MRAEHIDGRYIVVRIGGDNSDTYAAERVTHTLDEVVEMANPDDGDSVEWCYVYSDDAGSARLIPGQRAQRNEFTFWQAYAPKCADPTHCTDCGRPFYRATGGTSFCKC